MRKTFTLSVLVLAMALGIAWSAADSSAPTEQRLRELEAQILGPAAGSVAAASCTVQCPPDFYNPSAPPVSCTSATGNCGSGSKGAVTFILCDGQVYFCPSYI